MLFRSIVGSNDTHVFDDNGKFAFEYKAKGQSDDEAREHIAEVNWIDKVAPTASIKYTEKENGNVIATLVDESEEIIILNNSSNRDYTFTKNGEFTFLFEDLAGNTGRATAKVDSIKEETTDPIQPGEPENPDEPEQPSEPENPDKPNKPTVPGDPESPENPSIPSKPDPSIPFNPSKPNPGNSEDKDDDHPIEEKPEPEEEDDKSDNENQKPNTENKNPISSDKTDKKEKSNIIKIVLGMIIVVIGSITAYIFFKNKKEK